MKIETKIEIDDVELLETHSGKTDHREWGKMCWLYPGDIVAVIGRESAKRVQKDYELNYERTSKTN
jgi:hypothetical protein